MSRPMKLYNHSLAPNPRRVRIFAAEKGINLTLEDVDILAGQSRTPEFLAKNTSGGVPVLEHRTPWELEEERKGQDDERGSWCEANGHGPAGVGGAWG